MTVIQIIDAFTFYGLDIIALAAVTCALVQVAKLTFLKKFNKKIVTFMPILFGITLYALYDGLCHLSVKWLFDNYVDVIEHGFSVGALSTLVYVWYEQFVREKKCVSATHGVIATLIAGYVPDERVESAAESICAAIQMDVTGNGASRIAEILNADRSEDVSETDVKILSRLIIETLAHLNAGK